jgi:hypothetical protein
LIIKNAGKIIIVKSFNEVLDILRKINNKGMKILIISPNRGIDERNKEWIKRLNAEIIRTEDRRLIKYIGLKIREKIEKLLRSNKEEKVILIADLNSARNYDFLDKYLFIRSIIHEISRFHNIDKTFFIGEDRDRRLIEYFTR